MMSHAPLLPIKVLGSRIQLQELLVEIPSPSLAGRSTALVQMEGQGKRLQGCDTCGRLLSRLSLICGGLQHLLGTVTEDSHRGTVFRQINFMLARLYLFLLLMSLSAPFFPACPLQMHPKDSSPNVPNLGLNSVPSIFALEGGWRDTE